GICVVGEDRVEDRIADLVAELVGKTLGHGLRREQVLRRVDDAAHWPSGFDGPPEDTTGWPVDSDAMVTADPLLQRAHALDAADPLAAFRNRFAIPDPEVVYFDGNSLGRPPLAALEASRMVGER